MFTGIVEETGTVGELHCGAKSSHLTIRANVILEGTQVGDSIATNGVCLTVTTLSRNSFKADVMAETMRCTNLSTLRPGDQVNLERALSLQNRLGGHIVSGHIDGLGRITNRVREDTAVWLTIRTNPAVLKYVLERGSIAIDGVSLTVARVGSEDFSVSLIPHTGAKTILLEKPLGATVNLECDVIGKYVEKLLVITSSQTTADFTDVSKVTSGHSLPPATAGKEAHEVNKDFLKRHGFI